MADGQRASTRARVVSGLSRISEDIETYTQG